jgi:hypothetical protein
MELAATKPRCLPYLDVWDTSYVYHTILVQPLSVLSFLSLSEGNDNSPPAKAKRFQKYSVEKYFSCLLISP